MRLLEDGSHYDLLSVWSGGIGNAEAPRPRVVAAALSTPLKLGRRHRRAALSLSRKDCLRGVPELAASPNPALVGSLWQR